MLARRGVIADQLTDSQVQEVLGNSPRDSSPSQSKQRPEPTDATEPCGTIPPPDSQSNKDTLRQAQGKHHNHHQWDNLQGITSEAEVLRQMRGQGQGSEGNRPKQMTLEGQAESTPQPAESKGKQRDISRGRESTESHG